MTVGSRSEGVIPCSALCLSAQRNRKGGAIGLTIDLGCRSKVVGTRLVVWPSATGSFDRSDSSNEHELCALWFGGGAAYEEDRECQNEVTFAILRSKPFTFHALTCHVLSTL